MCADGSADARPGGARVQTLHTGCVADAEDALATAWRKRAASEPIRGGCSMIKKAGHDVLFARAPPSSNVNRDNCWASIASNRLWSVIQLGGQGLGLMELIFPNSSGSVAHARVVTNTRCGSGEIDVSYPRM